MATKSKYHGIYKYPNGATIVYFKQNLNNTTKMLVGYVCGSKKDKIPGTAHFLEHMLLKETPEISELQCSTLLKEMNVNNNAFTTGDVIMLYADSPNSSFSQTCDLYSSLLFNRKFDKKGINLERGAIEEEINMYANEGEGRTDTVSLITSNIIVDDPATAQDTLGSKETIAKIDGEILNHYIDDNFVSENMVIVVVSNQDFEDIKGDLEEKFVNKAISNPEKRNTYTKTKYYPNSNYIMKMKNDMQQTIDVSVSFMTKEKEKKSILYSYIEDYIFNGFSGKLLNEIRVKKGLAYYAGMNITPLPNDMTIKTFQVLTSREKVNDAIRTLGKIIKDIGDNGITEKELENLKKSILIREEDRAHGLKNMDPFVILQRYLEGTEVFFNNPIHEIKNLTLEEVNNYLKTTYKYNNAFVYINGNYDDKTMYSNKELEKILNIKKTKCYFDTAQEKYFDVETNQEISEDKAMQILDSVKEENKLARLLFTQEVDFVESQKQMEEMLLKSLPVEERIKIANNFLKTLGFDVALKVKVVPVEITEEREENLDEEPTDEELRQIEEEERMEQGEDMTK